MPKVVEKVIEGEIKGHKVTVKFEFNTEDIGMSIATTMDTEFFKEFEAKAKKSFGIDSPEIEKCLTEHMGKKGYEEYKKLSKESLADYASWAKEIDNQDKVTAKVKYFEDGRCISYINGKKREGAKLSEDMAKEALMRLRSIFIHGEMPKDLR